nr:DUF3971 domain-containing protein [Actibacterium sp. 188UL27-1]
MDGQITVNGGQITRSDADPVPFDAAQIYLSYAPETGRIDIDDLQVRAPQATVVAAGHAYLERDSDDRAVGSIVQLQLSQVNADPSGVFEQAAVFQEGALDLRARFDPSQVDLGQLYLKTVDAKTGAPTHIRATGKGHLTSDGWDVALDATVDRADYSTVLALWPQTEGPRTRQWLIEHLSAGTIFDATAAFRSRPGQKLESSVVYEFADATLRPIDTLPPITGASGYASIRDHAYTMTLDQGGTLPDQGGQIDLAGSVFRIRDMREQPTPGSLTLQTDATITATLSLLDLPPFNVMSRASLPVDLAQGRAVATSQIDLPLRKVTIDDVQFAVTGTLSDVQSDIIVPNRILAAQTLDLQASNQEVSIGGAGALDTVPLRATWVKALGEEAADQGSRVEGTVELSPTFVDRFNIGLPDGMISGAGQGQFAVNLPQTGPPRFELTSDLNRVGLRIAELGWRKDAAQKGSLAVAGQLGDTPRIDTLSLKAGGLTAEGRVSVTPGGNLEAATFSRFALDGWIDAPVTLRGRGGDSSPAVAIRGGWVDLRRANIGGGSGGSRAGGPMTVALDSLIISENISLGDFRATLNRRGGLNGEFEGKVNGTAPVTGQVAPGQGGGTAVRMTSGNAGAVFSAAGLFRKARGGDMTLVLNPTGKAGSYNGQLKVKNTKVQSAPGLAAILNTISVVGLLEQLNGPGLLFNDIDAVFRLTPNAVQITRASGVGPSVGISLAGVFDIEGNRMDVQGVLSPIYVLNGIGQIFSRRGEGLFGFNYRMRGAMDRPRVTVNPLSVLTPGMFREIFRRPPPSLGQ